MEPLVSRYYFYPLILLILTYLIQIPLVRSGDTEALLSLKSSIDPFNSLSSWQNGGDHDVCKWQGIKECLNGRVTKLVLEYLNLTGTLDEKIINQLDQLRVLSFKGNSISGQIPNLHGLVNLKSLYLNNNNFSGKFPDSLSRLHRLKIIVLANNQISGPIPESLLNLKRLYMLYLQDNKFTGSIPPFNQTTLRFFNVSNNDLSGQIPVTPALVRFNASSFLLNIDLCGEQIQRPCKSISFGPALSPAYPTKPSSKKHRLVKIIAASVGGLVLLLIICIVLYVCLFSRKRNKKGRSSEVRGKGIVGGEGLERGEPSGAGGGNAGVGGGKFSWEGEGLGSLVFCGPGDQQMSYSLEDLLKASAETLGRGTIGSTYKAVLESGFIVTVKRLKDARYPRLEEFRRHMDIIGRLRHPNLVPLRAYFQAKEERLLVYDYFPNGSLFSLIHGMHCLVTRLFLTFYFHLID